MEKTVRIVTRGRNGEIRSKDYPHTEAILKMHTQIGIDDCSTDLSLRGFPVFRGLIGPMPDGQGVVRYESPEVFETLTKEWGAPTPKKKRVRKKTQKPVDLTKASEMATAEVAKTPEIVPVPVVAMPESIVHPAVTE